MSVLCFIKQKAKVRIRYRVIENVSKPYSTQCCILVSDLLAFVFGLVSGMGIGLPQNSLGLNLEFVFAQSLTRTIFPSKKEPDHRSNAN